MLYQLLISRHTNGAISLLTLIHCVNENNVDSNQLASSEAMFDFMTSFHIPILAQDHTINLKLGMENEILFNVNKVVTEMVFVRNAHSGKL